jgi:hypothetical protein
MQTFYEPITLVPSPSLVATPGYSFSTSENGTISYAEGCSSTTTSAFGFLVRHANL